MGKTPAQDRGDRIYLRAHQQRRIPFLHRTGSGGAVIPYDLLGSGSVDHKDTGGLLVGEEDTIGSPLLSLSLIAHQGYHPGPYLVCTVLQRDRDVEKA